MKQKAMVFVDGSNFLIELFRLINSPQQADVLSDGAIGLASHMIRRAVNDIVIDLDSLYVIRWYWFGSVVGSEEVLADRRATLHRSGFEPILFHKMRSRAEKGVDLAVAREMLIHAFNRNYEVAILVAGDSDYVELVHDLKRLGIVVVGSFLDVDALHPKLRLAFDSFRSIELPLDQPALIERAK